MKKRVIALVLSVFMVLNPLTSYAAAPETTEASETTEVSETAEVPETTEVAETTAVPDTTEIPETTAVPETTEVSETTEVPETTEVAETTEASETTAVPETTAVTNTAAESVAVADRFLLNYQEISINMESGYPLPLYLTTGYYTEPSGTGKITWSSSDESVAAVDGEGRVTPVKPGEAIIKAVTTRL